MIEITWSRQPDDMGYYTLSLDFSATTDWIMLPSSITQLSVAVHPAVGQTARIEYTLSSMALCRAGTAKWIAWDLGDVSVSSADELMSCATAIRGVRSAGTATLEVRAS